MSSTDCLSSLTFKFGGLSVDLLLQEIMPKLHVKEINATSIQNYQLIQKDGRVWYRLLGRDYNMTRAPTNKFLRTWKDIYKMEYLGRHVPLDFSEQPLMHKVGIVLVGTVFSPFILLFLSPKIMRKTWSHILVPGNYLQSWSKIQIISGSLWVKGNIITPTANAITYCRRKTVEAILLAYSVSLIAQAKLVSPAIDVISRILYFFYFSIPYFIMGQIVRPIYCKLVQPLSTILQRLIRFYYVRVPFAVLREVIAPIARTTCSVTRFYKHLIEAIVELSVPAIGRLLAFYLIQIPLGVKDTIIPVTRAVLGAVAWTLFVAPVRVYQHVLLPFGRTSVRTYKYTRDNIIVPTANKLKPLAKSVADWNNRVWIQPSINGGKKLLQFYTVSLPKAIYNEVLLPSLNAASNVGRFYARVSQETYHEAAPKVAATSKVAGSFYLKRLPLAVASEVCLPVAQKSGIISRFYLQSLPVGMARVYGPSVAHATFNACKFYGYDLPRHSLQEIVQPAAIGVLRAARCEIEIFLYVPLLLTGPINQIAAFYSRLLSLLCRPIPSILRFYFVQLPLAIFNETKKTLIWIATTLKLATLSFYDKVLTPLGWRIYGATKVIFDAVKKFGLWIWTALFLPMVKVFKQMWESVRKVFVAVKDVVVQVSKSLWNVAKDLIRVLREFLKGLQKALYDFYVGIRTELAKKFSE